MDDEKTVDNFLDDGGNTDDGASDLDALDDALAPEDTPSDDSSPNDQTGAQDGDDQEPGSQDASPEKPDDPKGDKSWKGRYENLKPFADKMRNERDLANRELATRDKLDAAAKLQQTPQPAGPKLSTADKLVEKYGLDKEGAVKLQGMVKDSLAEEMAEVKEGQRTLRNAQAFDRFEKKHSDWRDYYQGMAQIIADNPDIGSLENAAEVSYVLAKEAKSPELTKAIEKRVREETLRKVKESTPTSGGGGAGAAPSSEQVASEENQILDGLLGPPKASATVSPDKFFD